MQNDSTAIQDGALRATVQFPEFKKRGVLSLGVPCPEAVAEAGDTLAFYGGIRAAVMIGDAALLRRHVPSLTKAEARVILFHGKRRRAPRGLIQMYGFEPHEYALATWGDAPPRVMVQASEKVRVAGLLAQFSALSPEMARACVLQVMADELDAEPGEPGSFWRSDIDEPHMQDQEAARLLLGRQRPALASVISLDTERKRREHAQHPGEVKVQAPTWATMYAAMDYFLAGLKDIEEFMKPSDKSVLVAAREAETVCRQIEAKALGSTCHNTPMLYLPLGTIACA